jgi:hypothetical protein
VGEHCNKEENQPEDGHDKEQDDQAKESHAEIPRPLP